MFSVASAGLAFACDNSGNPPGCRTSFYCLSRVGANGRPTERHFFCDRAKFFPGTKFREPPPRSQSGELFPGCGKIS
jgi:hypothetical protein